MFGLGNLAFTNNVTPPSPPPVIPVTGANNGATLSGTNVQLGQNLGAVGNPGTLLSNREIPLNGFSLELKGVGIELEINDLTNSFRITNNGINEFLLIDILGGDYAIGDYWGTANGNYIEVGDFADFISLDTKSTALGRTGFGSLTTNAAGGKNLRYNQAGGYYLDIDPINFSYKIGDVLNTHNGLFLNINDANGKAELRNTAGTSKIRINGVDGFTGTVTPVTSITVNGGIVTAVS